MTFEAQLSRAMALQEAGDLSAAMGIYKGLLPKNRKNPDLLVRTAIAALSLGDTKQAKNLARQVLKLHPDAGVAHNILGLAELKEKGLTRALSHFKTAIQYSPNDAQTRINLGELLSQLNRGEEAVVHLQEAVRLAPKFTKARYALGVTLKGVGQIEQSIEMVRSVLDLNPLSASAWKTLAYMGGTCVEKDVELMEAACERLADQPFEKAKIQFALFATYENEKKYAQAFECLEAGNRLVAMNAKHDVGTDELMMREISTAFAPSVFERFANVGDRSQEPIFIVGLPRSGTTLVEHILAGHSHVDGCGELNAIEDAIIKIGAKSNAHYPQVVQHWKKNDIKGIARTYLESLKAYAVAAPRFTDKMPENFLFLGVIRLAFPKARIIHCRRNPIDTCLANYRQMLSGSHPQIYDQDDLVRYYKAYQSLMGHWHDVMGDVILDVNYEDLVAEPETQAKRLLSFCDLTWEAQCIDTRKTDRAVHTASAAQIRDGIHKDFVERWKRYEPYIKTLIDGVG